MADKIQLRRDTAANWTSVDPVLSQGEIGIETDTDKFKIGDGISKWSELDYAYQAVITGAATTITDSNLTVNRALISDGSGKVAVSSITSTELGHLEGAASNIQNQIDLKVTLDTAQTLSNKTLDSTCSLAGNAATATALNTARNINGISFDGTANIVVSDRVGAAGTSGTVSLDLSASDMFQMTPSGTVTFEFTGTPAGKSIQIKLLATGTSRTINFPDSVKMPSYIGSLDWTNGNRHIFTLTTADSGTSWDLAYQLNT